MAADASQEWRALAAQHLAGEIVLGDNVTTIDV